MQLRKPAGRNNGFTLVEMLVVIAIIGILAGIMLPAIQSVREIGRRTQCQNNLRQLGVATLAYHSTWNKFPSSIQPAGLVPAPRVSVMTLLLPFVGHDNVYQKYDRTKSFNDPANLRFTSKPVDNFMCSSTPEIGRQDGDSYSSPWTPQLAVTDYSPTLGVDQRLKAAGLVDECGYGVMTKNGEPSLTHVTDGYSYTILFAESAGRPYIYRRGYGKVGMLPTDRVNGGGWARPESDFMVDGSSLDGATAVGSCALNCTNGEAVGNFPDPYYGTEGTAEMFGFHPGGASALFVDGSVRLIAENIDIRELAKLITRAGKEPNL